MEREIVILDRVFKQNLTEMVLLEEIYVRKSILGRRAGSAKVPNVGPYLAYSKNSKMTKSIGSRISKRIGEAIFDA